VRTVNNKGPVLSVSFSPDGMQLASGSHTAKIIDIATGAIKRIVKHQGIYGPVSSVCFSPDGTQLATGSEDWTAKITDIITGKILMTLHHQNVVHSVRFSPNGR